MRERNEGPMALSYICELAIEHYDNDSWSKEYALHQIRRICQTAEQHGVHLLWGRKVVRDVDRFVEEEIGEL